MDELRSGINMALRGVMFGVKIGLHDVNLMMLRWF